MMKNLERAGGRTFSVAAGGSWRQVCLHIAGCRGLTKIAFGHTRNGFPWASMDHTSENMCVCVRMRVCVYIIYDGGFI